MILPPRPAFDEPLRPLNMTEESDAGEAGDEPAELNHPRQSRGLIG